MAEREAKFKLGYFNVFNLGGALYGWMHGHTWEDAAIGFLAGSILPVVVILGVLAIGLTIHKMIDAFPTRTRIAECVRVETDNERWEREYAEHCKATGIPNELGAPIRQEPEADFIVERPTYSGYTSGGGPG